MKKNNPATRLWAILELGFKVTSDASTRSVWAQLLGVKAESTTQLLSALRDINLLLEETLELVAGQPQMAQEVYHHNIALLRSVLDPVHLNSPWNQVRSRISETSLTVLRLAGDWLQATSDEDEVSPADIDLLRKEVDELLEQVLNTDLPHDLRDFIVRQLEQVRAACLTYKLRGAKGLRRALEQIAGSFALEKNHAKAAQKSPVGDKFDRILSRFAALVEASNRTRELLEPFVPVIVGLLNS